MSFFFLLGLFLCKSYSFNVIFEVESDLNIFYCHSVHSLFLLNTRTQNNGVTYFKNECNLLSQAQLRAVVLIATAASANQEPLLDLAFGTSHRSVSEAVELLVLCKNVYCIGNVLPKKKKLKQKKMYKKILSSMIVIS